MIKWNYIHWPLTTIVWIRMWKNWAKSNRGFCWSGLHLDLQERGSHRLYTLHIGLLLPVCLCLYVCAHACTCVVSYSVVYACVHVGVYCMPIMCISQRVISGVFFSHFSHYFVSKYLSLILEIINSARVASQWPPEVYLSTPYFTQRAGITGTDRQQHLVFYMSVTHVNSSPHACIFTNMYIKVCVHLPMYLSTFILISAVKD